MAEGSAMSTGSAVDPCRCISWHASNVAKSGKGTWRVLGVLIHFYG